MTRWYIGDGIAGFRAWAWARVVWRFLPWRLYRPLARLAPRLPPGVYYSTRVDGRGLYARRDR